MCKSKGYKLITYINSKATHWGEIEVGDNCFIFEGNVIQPFVKIGNDVIMWSGNHIGHDSSIGDHCFIASHAVISGNVRIGPYCFIGVNATFRDGIIVAPECIIGAGALILKDTIEKGVYKGHKSESAPYASSNLKEI
jgi:sugar O-acyltransferase (sialic acid O-acetyltransferase NeuD family)